MTNDHLGVCRSAPPSFFESVSTSAEVEQGFALHPLSPPRARGADKKSAPDLKRYPRQKSKGASRLYFAGAKSPPGKYAPLTFMSAPLSVLMLLNGVFLALRRI